jgi:ABC-type uncharacterized transport system permease subunit
MLALCLIVNSFMLNYVVVSLVLVKVEGVVPSNIELQSYEMVKHVSSPDVFCICSSNLISWIKVPNGTFLSAHIKLFLESA